MPTHKIVSKSQHSSAEVSITHRRHILRHRREMLIYGSVHSYLWASRKPVIQLEGRKYYTSFTLKLVLRKPAHEKTRKPIKMCPNLRQGPHRQVTWSKGNFENKSNSNWMSVVVLRPQKMQWSEKTLKLCVKIYKKKARHPPPGLDVQVENAWGRHSNAHSLRPHRQEWTCEHTTAAESRETEALPSINTALKGFYDKIRE